MATSNLRRFAEEFYINKSITKEQAARAIDIVRGSDLTELIWAFEIGRNFLPEESAELQRLIAQFVASRVLRGLKGSVQVSQVQLYGEIEGRSYQMQPLGFDIDERDIVGAGNVIVGAGLHRATARLKTSELQDTEFLIGTTSGKPERFRLRVPNRHYSGSSNSNALSVEYCDKLNEMLKLI
jgi:hypothetical protein